MLVAERNLSGPLTLDFYEVPDEVGTGGFFTWKREHDAQPFALERKPGEPLIIRMPSMRISLARFPTSVQLNTYFKQDRMRDPSGLGKTWKAVDYLRYTTVPYVQFERTQFFKDDPAFVRRVVAFLMDRAERSQSTVYFDTGQPPADITDEQWLRAAMLVSEAFLNIDGLLPVAPETLMRQLQYAAGALTFKARWEKEGKDALYGALKAKWNDLPRTTIEELRGPLLNDRPEGYKDKLWKAASSKLREDMLGRRAVFRRLQDKRPGLADALADRFVVGTLADFTLNWR